MIRDYFDPSHPSLFSSEEGKWNEENRQAHERGEALIPITVPITVVVRAGEGFENPSNVIENSVFRASKELERRVLDEVRRSRMQFVTDVCEFRQAFSEVLAMVPLRRDEEGLWVTGYQKSASFDITKAKALIARMRELALAWGVNQEHKVELLRDIFQEVGEILT